MSAAAATASSNSIGTNVVLLDVLLVAGYVSLSLVIALMFGFLATLGVYYTARFWVGRRYGFTNKRSEAFREERVTMYGLNTFVSLQNYVQTLWQLLRSVQTQAVQFILTFWPLLLALALFFPLALLWDTYHDVFFVALHKLYACFLAPVLRPLILTPLNLLRFLGDYLLPLSNAIVEVYRFLFYGPLYQVLRCGLNTLLESLRTLGVATIETFRAVGLWLIGTPLEAPIALFEAGKLVGQSLASFEVAIVCICASLQNRLDFISKPLLSDNFACAFNASGNVLPLLATQVVLQPVVGTLRNVADNGGQFTLEQLVRPTWTPALDTACTALECSAATVDQALGLFYESQIETLLVLFGAITAEQVGRPPDLRPPLPSDPGQPGLPPPLIQCIAQGLCALVIEPAKYTLNLLTQIDRLLTSPYEAQRLLSLQPIVDRWRQAIECVCEFLDWLGDTLLYFADVLAFEVRGGAGLLLPVANCPNTQRSCFDDGNVQEAGCATETCCRIVCNTPGLQFCCTQSWQQVCQEAAEALCINPFRSVAVFLANGFVQGCCFLRQAFEFAVGLIVNLVELLLGTVYSLLTQLGYFDVFLDQEAHWGVEELGSEQIAALRCRSTNDASLRGNSGYGNRWSTCAQLNLPILPQNFDTAFVQQSSFFHVPDSQFNRDVGFIELSLDGGETWGLPPVHVLQRDLDANQQLLDIAPLLRLQSDSSQRNVSLRLRFYSDASGSDADSVDGAIDTPSAWDVTRFNVLINNTQGRIFTWQSQFDFGEWQYSACQPPRFGNPTTPSVQLDFFRQAKALWGDLVPQSEAGSVVPVPPSAAVADNVARPPNRFNDTLEAGVQAFVCAGNVLGLLCDQCQVITCLFEVLPRAVADLALVIIDFFVHLGDIIEGRGRYLLELSLDPLYENILQAGRCVRDGLWALNDEDRPCSEQTNGNNQPLLTSSDFWCCLGAASEALLRLVVGILRPFTDIVRTLIQLFVDPGSLDPSIFNQLFDFDEAYQATGDFIFAFVCLNLSGFIPFTWNCVNGTSPARFEVTQAVSTMLTSLVLVLPRIIVSLAQALLNLLLQAATTTNGGDSDLVQIIVPVIQPLADLVIDFLRGIGEFFRCAIDETFGQTLIDVAELVVEEVLEVLVLVASQLIAFLLLVVFGLIQAFATGFSDLTLLGQAFEELATLITLFFCTALGFLACPIEATICGFGGQPFCVIQNVDPNNPVTFDICGNSGCRGPDVINNAQCTFTAFACDFNGGCRVHPYRDAVGRECCLPEFVGIGCKDNEVNVGVLPGEDIVTLDARLNNRCPAFPPDATCRFPEGICAQEGSGDCCSARTETPMANEWRPTFGGCDEPNCCRCVSALLPQCTTLWSQDCAVAASNGGVCESMCSCANGDVPQNKICLSSLPDSPADTCCDAGEGCNEPSCCQASLNWLGRNDTLPNRIRAPNPDSLYAKCVTAFNSDPRCAEAALKESQIDACTCNTNKKRKRQESHEHKKSTAPLPDGFKQQASKKSNFELFLATLKRVHQQMLTTSNDASIHKRSLSQALFNASDPEVYDAYEFIAHRLEPARQKFWQSFGSSSSSGATRQPQNATSYIDTLGSQLVRSIHDQSMEIIKKLPAALDKLHQVYQLQSERQLLERSLYLGQQLLHQSWQHLKRQWQQPQTTPTPSPSASASALRPWFQQLHTSSVNFVQRVRDMVERSGRQMIVKRQDVVLQRHLLRARRKRLAPTIDTIVKDNNSVALYLEAFEQRTPVLSAEAIVPLTRRITTAVDDSGVDFSDYFGDEFQCDPAVNGVCFNCTILNEFIFTVIDASNCLGDYYAQRAPEIQALFEEATTNVLVDPIGTDTFSTVDKRTPFVLSKLNSVRWPWLWDYSEFIAIFERAVNSTSQSPQPQEHAFRDTLRPLQEQRAAAQGRADLDVDALDAVESLTGDAFSRTLEDVVNVLANAFEPATTLLIDLFETYLECDERTMLKCDNGGTGLFDALVIIGLLILVLSFVLLTLLPCIPASIILMLLLLVSPVLVVWIGYRSNPLCTVRGLPSLTVALPACLPDDLYDLASGLLPQCSPIPVELILPNEPGADQLCAACQSLPPVGHCCTLASMCDGLDNLLYIAESSFGLNEALASNALIQALPYVPQRLSLWTAERIDSDPQLFSVCNQVTSPNILAAVVVLVLSLLLTTALIAAAFFLLYALVILTLAIFLGTYEMLTQVEQSFVQRLDTDEQDQGLKRD